MHVAQGSRGGSARFGDHSCMLHHFPQATRHGAAAFFLLPGTTTLRLAHLHQTRTWGNTRPPILLSLMQGQNSLDCHAADVAAAATLAKL